MESENTTCGRSIKVEIPYESHGEIVRINESDIFDHIPEVDSDGTCNSMQPGSLFKYAGCYYRLEGDGEISLVSTDVDGRLVIPKSITINGNDYPVTRIGEMERFVADITHYPGSDRRRKPEVGKCRIRVGAFYSSQVTECIFPSTLREFSGDITSHSCENLPWFFTEFDQMMNAAKDSSLKKISFSEEGSGTLESIGSEVFKNCQLEMDCLQLPEGLRHIGDNVFSGKFRRIKLPSTIETIGDNAFGDCEIRSINLPEGLKSVGDKFIDITYFTEKIEFPSTIKRIPKLEWSAIDRWHEVKSLPEIVVHNGRKDVVLDKFTSKNCKIEYIDEIGEREIDRKIIRNFCFKKKHPCDFEELNKYHVSLVVLSCFMLFWLLLIVVLVILVATGVLE